MNFVHKFLLGNLSFKQIHSYLKLMFDQNHILREKDSECNHGISWYMNRTKCSLAICSSVGAGAVNPHCRIIIMSKRSFCSRASTNCKISACKFGISSKSNSLATKNSPTHEFLVLIEPVPLHRLKDTTDN